MGADVPEAAHVLAAYQALADVDIIHDHTILGPLLAGRRRIRRPPVVTTVHGPITPQNRRSYAEAARHAAIVAISHAQARSAAGIPIAAVIHHGIDLDTYRPGPGTGGYLLFVGRMCADKGVHHAVRIARRAGWRLIIESIDPRRLPSRPTSTTRCGRCSRRASTFSPASHGPRGWS